MGFYVSYVELCHGKPRQLTTEIYFGSMLPRKTLIVKCRELLVKKILNEKKATTANFSKKKFLCFFCFVLIHYGIDVYALVSC